MRPDLSFFALFFFCVSALGAQSAPSPQEPGRQVAIRLVSAASLVGDLAVATTQGRTRLVVRPNVFTADVSAIVVDGRVHFYRHPRPVLAPGESESPVASFSARTDISRYIVLVSASGTGGSRVHRVHAIPDHPGTLPAEHARVFNATWSPLAVQLGSANAIVAPADSSVLPCAPGVTRQISRLLAIPESASSSEWELASSSQLHVPPGLRVLMVVYPNEAGGGDFIQGGPLSVTTIYDRPVPIDAPAGH